MVAHGLAAVFVWAISKMPPAIRDLAPLAWTYAAYRQMDWFTPIAHAHHLENTWIVWDRWLLDRLHMRAAIESGGILAAAYFELSYALIRPWRSGRSGDELSRVRRAIHLSRKRGPRSSAENSYALILGQPAALASRFESNPNR